MGGSIVTNCVGCARVVNATNCSTFANPAAKWRVGGCGMATHIEFKADAAQKVRVGQQKQRKGK